MVNHLVIHAGLAAELWVLVFDRVEAVRAGGHKLLELVLLHGLDIRLRLLLVQHFLAHAPGRVAGAGFLFAQDGEIHTGALEQLHH